MYFSNTVYYTDIHTHEVRTQHYRQENISFWEETRMGWVGIRPLPLSEMRDKDNEPSVGMSNLMMGVWHSEAICCILGFEMFSQKDI